MSKQRTALSISTNWKIRNRVNNSKKRKREGNNGLGKALQKGIDKLKVRMKSWAMTDA